MEVVIEFIFEAMLEEKVWVCAVIVKFGLRSVWRQNNVKDAIKWAKVFCVNKIAHLCNKSACFICVTISIRASTITQ